MIYLVGVKDVAEVLKDIGEMIGWLAAAAFFLYKVGSGYLISGLSLRVRCRRTVINGESHVAVTGVVKKGNIGTTQLHDAMIVIRDLSTGDIVGEPTRFRNIRRLACDFDKPHLEIIPSQISLDAPLLNFAPGDEMQFAGVAKLPNDEVYIVETIILGKRIVAWTRFLPNFLGTLKKHIQDRQNYFVGQWRATCVLASESKQISK
jgi:hypothetical protein